MAIGDEVFDLNDVGKPRPLRRTRSDLTRTAVSRGLPYRPVPHPTAPRSAAWSPQTLPLREQVLFALSVAETDAQLDAYTDGYYYRVLEARNARDPDGSTSKE